MANSQPALKTPPFPEVVFISGGSAGIGEAIALKCAGAGMDVAIADLNRNAKLEAKISRLGRTIKTYVGDIAQLAFQEKLISQLQKDFGVIHFHIANAGMGAKVRGDALAITRENFDRIMGVNLRGAMFLSQAIAQLMLKQKSKIPPRIIFITSVSAHKVSLERLDYCISKAGLAMWARGLALRLAPHNIAVFEIRPGIIRTNLTTNISAPARARHEKNIKNGLVPMRRWGEPNDVAGVVLDLLRPHWNFATGSVIAIDGGLAIEKL